MTKILTLLSTSLVLWTTVGLASPPTPMPDKPLAPISCDSSEAWTYYGIQAKADARWCQCYIDTAHEICPKEKTGYSCARDDLSIELRRAYHTHVAECHRQQARGLLPAGVSEQDCENDWTAFVQGAGGAACPQSGYSNYGT